MSRLKLISLSTVLGLSLLQAADPTDKTSKEKCALPDRIRLPHLLSVFDRKEPEKVSLARKDPITGLTFEEHIKRACDKDLP